MIWIILEMSDTRSKKNAKFFVQDMLWYLESISTTTTREREVFVGSRLIMSMTKSRRARTCRLPITYLCDSRNAFATTYFSDSLLVLVPYTYSTPFVTKTKLQGTRGNQSFFVYRAKDTSNACARECIVAR